MKESLKTKFAKSRLKWAGHEERMGDENWQKRADAQKVERKWRRGIPRTRSEDCINTDLERVKGDWRTTAKDRSWRLLIDKVARKQRGKTRRQ